MSNDVKDAADLFSRNWAFISPELQHTLDRTCLFTAGAGLSSAIAVLACRTGFGSFILADGDQVEVSNLNRQAFFRRQVGQNKATATAELLHDIRPDVAVTSIPEFIEGDSYLSALDHANIIINAIDYDNPALFALARDARTRGIPMLIALNLGWGGAVMVFTADSMPLDEFLGLAAGEDHSASEVSARLITRAFSGEQGVPPYLAEILADYQVNGAQWACEPQLGPTVSLTAAMVVRVAISLIAGEPVPVTPAVFHVDLRVLLESSVSHAIPASASAKTAATAETPHATPPEPTLPKAPKSAESVGATIQRMPTEKKSDDFNVYLRSRQLHARYPKLTELASKEKNLLFLRNRPSGSWTYAIRHDMLPDDAMQEFGEFRIDQYALAGLYDTSKIAQHGYRTDPTLTGLAGNTIHVISGTSGGQVLACCSIVPPKGPLYSEPTGWLVKRRRPLVLGDDERALFPSETELFGRGVFESLPAIQEIPIERMREIAHLMRNQAIRSPLTGLAVFELVYALTVVLTNPRMGIDIMLGSSGPEARNLMARANIPMLYATWATVVVSETLPEEDFWIPPTNADQYFWPYVIATADLQALKPFHEQLDSALGSPAQQVRGALVRVANLARQPGGPQPQFALQAQMPPRWFISEPFGPPIPSASESPDL
jgi:molybdopterin/thiamine biosynthesis adenylyltransferase